MITDNYKGIIKSISKAANDTFGIEIFFKDKQAARQNFVPCEFIPGKFISVLCPNKTLRRPFSICGFNAFEDGFIIKILFKLKGEGTNYLKSLEKDDVIDFIAPLGNGFNISNKKSLLVGAGIGIAPMLFLKDELNKRNIENYLISGFKSVDEVIQGSDENVIGGSVLDNIENIIEENNIEIIYSCGPQIVLQKLSEIANKHNIESQLALEKVMACGIGVCRGCVIKIKRNNEIKTVSICKDGPVFLGSELLWQ